MKRATWKLNDISEVSEQESQGCIRAKFDLDNGPSKPGATALQFAAEGATLSGADFELAGPGYRISLLKKRFSTGKVCFVICLYSLGCLSRLLVFLVLSSFMVRLVVCIYLDVAPVNQPPMKMHT